MYLRCIDGPNKGQCYDITLDAIKKGEVISLIAPNRAKTKLALGSIVTDIEMTISEYYIYEDEYSHLHLKLKGV